MDKTTIFTALVVGILFGLYQAGSLIVILPVWPDKLTILKVVAASIVSFCMGIGAYMVNPQKVWEMLSAGKKPDP